MPKYLAVYNRKRIEVDADSSYEAQKVAVKEFAAKRSYEVDVYLLEDNDGKAVVHSTQHIG